MKFLSRLATGVVVLLCFVPGTLFAQGGVRMSADFFPLEVGNQWIYDLVNEGGQKVGSVDFSIKEHRIIDGRSFYVLTGFPFASVDGDMNRLIRYDRQERQYMSMTDNEEGPLFLADGTKTEVIQADQSGLPLKFVLRMDLIDLTFQRGIGIVEAQMHGGGGIQVAKLTAMRVGERRSGDAAATAAKGGPALPQPKTPEQKTKELTDSVAAISETNPALDVQAIETAGGHKFVLAVINTSDKLLPFSFKSSQTYDFAVIDVITGQEVWRWSRRMFFTQVVRTETIRADKNWTFEIIWNHRDNDLNPVEAGKYAVVGIVATLPPIESEPVTFEIK